jgi:imidazole glycerol phosphate synthase glutamine amidotransferase subunit
VSEVVVVATGVANVASVKAALERAGARPRMTAEPSDVELAELVVLPGVGAFGAAMDALRGAGLVGALAARARQGRPLLAICLGMQLLAESSEESAGVRGLGVLPGTIRRFPESVRVPQLGWNQVRPADDSRLLSPGWACFANSYRLTDLPAGWTGATAEHGGRFLAAVERGAVLGCQFHPELSGEWGLALVSRWIEVARSRQWAVGSGQNVGDVTPTTGASEITNGRQVAVGSRQQIPRVTQSLTEGRQPAGGSGQFTRVTRVTPISQSPEPRAARAPGGVSVRIIPCLDCDGGRVVKGVRFAGLRDAGDPVERAAAYEAQGADELVLLDVSASPSGRGHHLETVRAIRRVLGIPLTAGGGVRTAEDVARLLEAGADKVAVNTAAFRDPAILTAMAERFGVQCTVVAVDARQVAVDHLAITDLAAGYSRSGRSSSWQVVIESGRVRTGCDAVAWAREAVQRGAGEILLTSFDRDGTREGYDLALIRAVAAAVGVPVIASGGAETPDHLLEAVLAGADAVLAASIFHDGDRTVGELKEFLNARGVRVRG